MAARALTSFLDAEGITYELLPHTHTERAVEEAIALGVSPESVAKTLVLTVPDGYVRAVLPASDRLDLHKVRDLIGASSKQVHLASEDDLARDYAEFELGAVPPVGGRRDPVLVDPAIVEQDAVVFEAGDHKESIRLETGVLERLAGVRVAEIRDG
jgi:Ala-tRNA(Pro) deacylase